MLSTLVFAEKKPAAHFCTADPALFGLGFIYCLILLIFRHRFLSGAFPLPLWLF